MRRIRQQLTEEESKSILQNAYRGILAVNGDNGYPYALPINFVCHEGKIYFHCALRGHKMDSIKRDSKACFTVVDTPVKEEGSWWYHVKSVICFGQISIIEDKEKKLELLKVLGSKYFPEGYDIEEDLRKNGPGAAVLEFTIDHMTGKSVKEN